MAKYTIDPITRIEGHLRIDVEIEDGKVTNAWSSAQLFRGLEIILQGRDPRDAPWITQRACGVCTEVHALASIRALDDAVGVNIPPLARIARNLVHGAQFLHDHPVHFYVLSALDWVDVVSALKADPKKTAALANSLSDYPNSGSQDFRAVQKRVQTFVDSIMARMIFDGEHLSDLLAPQDLGWKERTKKELALMDDLMPLLKKLAQGRDISGLGAYEN